MLSDYNDVHFVLDIGNSSAKWAIFKGLNLIQSGKSSCEHLVSLITEKEREFHFAKRVYSNVSAAQFQFLDSWIAFKSELKSPWSINYSPESTLGVDRVAVAIGARHVSPLKLILIIDLGTCVTYTLIERHEITGLSITPGRNLRWKSMHHFTANLPLITPEMEIACRFSTQQNLWEGGHEGWLQEVLAMSERYAKIHYVDEILFTGSDAVYLKDFLPKRSRIIEGLNLIGLNVWLHEK